MFQCLPGLYSALFDKVQEKEEKAKCHPLTRFALWRSLVKRLATQKSSYEIGVIGEGYDKLWAEKHSFFRLLVTISVYLVGKTQG